MDKWAVVNWFGEANYLVMVWMDSYWWVSWFAMATLGCLIAMSPLKSHHEHSFPELVAIQSRKAILLVGFALILLPIISLYIYDMSMKNELGDSNSEFVDWFIAMSMNKILGVPQCAYPALGMLLGWTGRFVYKRYAIPVYSALLKRLRNEQTRDDVTDIRNESQRFKAKNFLPSKYYKPSKIFVGLDEKNSPIFTPYSTWRETNMQVIGPTRFGKGVALGCLMDQGIRLFDDAMFYIDPKGDTFAPYILKAAAEAKGKPFYFVSLRDNELGDWAPFSGGDSRAGLARLQSALGLELSGDPGTDFYKTQELRAIAKAFSKSRKILSLAKAMQGNDGAAKASAELDRWSAVKSLCPKGKGFSIAKALKEGAVVYLRGSLDDSIIKAATKVFIAETIQEAARLSSTRKHHLTIVVDEVRFLASKELGDALATIVGFDVNLVLAYQSIKDIEQPDDRTLNGLALAQSINVNCQLKLAYGGADFETAEWAANLSGTISKQVTKFEGTDVSDAGGEIWKQERMVGAQEENLINANMVLSFPPMVCMFKQTGELAKVAHTCFVPVSEKSKKSLDVYLSETLAKQGQQAGSPNDEKPALSHAKDSPPPQAFADSTESVEAINLGANLNPTNTDKNKGAGEKKQGPASPHKKGKKKSPVKSALDDPDSAAAIMLALQDEPIPDDASDSCEPSPPTQPFASETATDGPAPINSTKKAPANESKGGDFVLDLSKLDLQADDETLSFLDDEE